jgi:TPR repeat protein
MSSKNKKKGKGKAEKKMPDAAEKAMDELLDALAAENAEIKASMQSEPEQTEPVKKVKGRIKRVYGVSERTYSWEDLLKAGLITTYGDLQSRFKGVDEQVKKHGYLTMGNSPAAQAARERYHRLQLHGSMGNLESIVSLAGVYLVGQLVPRNLPLAAMMLKGAAEDGCSNAYAMLGVLYREGIHYERSPENALKMFIKSWKIDANAEAAYHLGQAHGYGDLVPRDYVKARSWFEKAAEKDHPRSLQNLMLMYTYGVGGPPDHLLVVSLESRLRAIQRATLGIDVDDDMK